MLVKSHKSFYLLSLCNYNFAFVQRKGFSFTPDFSFETGTNLRTNGRYEDKKTNNYVSLSGSGYFSIIGRHFSQSVNTTCNSNYYSTIIQIGNHQN